MEAIARNTTLEALSSALDECAAITPNLAIAFTSGEILQDKSTAHALKEKLPGALIIGCSTAGEISASGVTDGEISILCARFDHTELRATTAHITNAEASYSAGKEIAQSLNGDNLKLVFSLCPGTNVNGSEFVRGMNEELPEGVISTGGLAGDGTDFSQTYTLLNGDIYEQKVVSVGFYGDALLAKSAAGGGWKSFGPVRQVTKAKANIVYELDNKPALDLYKQYLGDKTEQLPASGLYYPFAIHLSNDTESGLIRTILDVNHDEGALVFAGDISEGSQVRLMHSDTDDLVGGAKYAAEQCQTHTNGTDSAMAILVSCIGRKLIMGDDVDEEIEAVLQAFGTHTSITGFYSYGEICKYFNTCSAELHNQTMTITYITEKL